MTAALAKGKWRALAAQWLGGLLCLISVPPVLYVAMVYAISSCYFGEPKGGEYIALLAITYPAVALVAVIVSAQELQRRQRFAWRIHLVAVGYLALIGGLMLWLGDIPLGAF
jgi:hypothetical protein